MRNSLSDMELQSYTRGSGGQGSGQGSSQGYYSNSSTSGAASSGALHGAIARRKPERNPADRLLRSVDFDAIERLTYQEELQRGNQNLARVTLQEKRLSLLCFQWRKRYKSVFFDDGESEYKPAKNKEEKK